MANLEAIPQIYIYNQNRRSCLGAVTNPIEFTEDIRFNACSEISFTVSDKYYDIDKEEWIDNPYYDNIERHKLVYITDNKDYFSYPVRAIGDENFYKYKDSINDLYNRTNNNVLKYHQNDNILNRNFEVQAETELFDIGSGSGYLYKHFAYIRTASSSSEYDEHGVVGHKVPGAIQDMSIYHWSSYAENFNHLLTIDSFIPVSPTDVIAYTTGGSTGNPSYKWKIAAYRDADAAEYVGYWRRTSYGSSRENVAELLPDGGYIRFEVDNIPNTSGCYYNYNSRSYGYTYPVNGFAKILSGERRCTRIKNSNTQGLDKSKMRWFQIQNVEEEADGFCYKKTVKALSYEYSLHQSTFSLSESTLPLYIPDPITDLVNSNNWIRDKVENSSDKIWRSPQHMERGVLNQILDYLPGWKVKNISSELMTSYRKLNDVDDVNIYTYLMDTIQSVYNCFIVFDNDDMTISVYSLSDINNLKSPVCLTWDNAIKSFKKDNMDASYYTALRVKTGDSTYGVGLVNPAGNSMIYNFDNIMDDLDYSVQGVPNAYKRTLKEAVTAWKTAYDAQMSESSYNMQYAKNIILYNMNLVKYESKEKEALADYRAKADVINTYLNDDRRNDLLIGYDMSQILVPDMPWSVERIQNGSEIASSVDPVEKEFHTGTLQDGLLSAAKAYWNAKSSYDTERLHYNAAIFWKKDVAKRLTMNYSQAYKANNGNEYAFSNSTTILSAAEIRELKNYIIEGTWNFENAVFSETYNNEDIFNTLLEVLTEAQSDLAQRLSIVNFDFTVDTTNILAIPEFKKVCDNLYMGHQIGLNVSQSEYITPMLLELHRDYKDSNDFSFTFTTDMKRRPIDFRFADLYSTITQTSVTDSAFTFDE